MASIERAFSVVLDNRTRIRIRQCRDVDNHLGLRGDNGSKCATAGEWAFLVPIFDFLASSDAANRTRFASQWNLDSEEAIAQNCGNSRRADTDWEADFSHPARTQLGDDQQHR